VGAAIGIAVGVFLGALVGWGILANDYNFYARRFLPGRTVLRVRADDHTEEAQAILRARAVRVDTVANHPAEPVHRM
jgi:hypothetical protein